MGTVARWLVGLGVSEDVAWLIVVEVVAVLVITHLFLSAAYARGRAMKFDKGDRMGEWLCMMMVLVLGMPFIIPAVIVMAVFWYPVKWLSWALGFERD